MTFLINALMYIYKKEEKQVKLINRDCLLILMLLHIMRAYLMLLAALSNAVCLYYAFFQMLFVSMLCLGLLTHSLFISCINLHHAQCF